MGSGFSLVVRHWTGPYVIEIDPAAPHTEEQRDQTGWTLFNLLVDSQRGNDELRHSLEEIHRRLFGSLEPPGGRPSPDPIVHQGRAETLRRDLEEAARMRRLRIYRQPLPRVLPLPSQEDTAIEARVSSEPTAWVEVIVTDSQGEPYVGPYRLELPNGRTMSGDLNAGGRVRVEGIEGGTCNLLFPDVHEGAVTMERRNG